MRTSIGASFVVFLALLVGGESTDSPVDIDVLATLANNGHIPVYGENSLVMLDELMIKNGIKNFQKFAGIEETGRIDATTLNKMVHPRCGNPDIEDDNPNTLGRKKRFVLSMNKWPKKILTFKVVKYSQQMAESEQDEVFMKSLGTWASHSRLSFRQIFDQYAETDLTISFGAKNHSGCNYDFHGPGGTLAHAFFPTIGKLHFDEDENWSISKYDNGFVNLAIVALHECGHALGLKHSYDMRSVMAAYYKAAPPTYELTEDDIKGIQILYEMGFKYTNTTLCKIDKGGTGYVGKVAVTKSGKTCQSWISKSPHSHSFTAEHFYSGSLTDQKNYCRNPDGAREQGPWCYTTDPLQEWEYCDVIMCRSNSKTTAMGKEYIGEMHSTVSGRTCQYWKDTIPHYQWFTESHDKFPHDDVEGNKNFCRNPDNDPIGPWCYTTDPDKRWEHCEIVYGVNVCQTKQYTHTYFGTEATTVSGKACQRWDEQTPHVHNYLDSTKFPAGSLSENENYCRNPDPENHPEGVWCYTSDKDVEWEYCNVEECGQMCRSTELGKDYTGPISQTREGIKCQRWDTSEPHYHTLGVNELFPDATVNDAANYCRNPDNDESPWCYTEDPDIRWDYCDIPKCQ